jgi:pimeloyl-ACP methyl ester carboxylesterase
MNLSVNCQEMDPQGGIREGSKSPATGHPLDELAQRDAQEKLLLCKQWLGEDWLWSRQPAFSSTIPTLILRGQYEALIPPEWNEQVAAGLPNSTSLTFPGSGHGVLAFNHCAQEAVAAFLRDPTTTPSISCEK